MKPCNPPLRSIRLLGQVRERIRYLHYSRSTEKVYLYWVRFFARRQGRHGTMTHLREMGAPQGEAFLTMLATKRKVSSSAHNQASSALLAHHHDVYPCAESGGRLHSTSAGCADRLMGGNYS